MQIIIDFQIDTSFFDQIIRFLSFRIESKREQSKRDVKG